MVSSARRPGRLSNLPNELLFLIISCLSFKECVKTSVLSKRWRYLYRGTRNVAFKASDFVSPSVYGITARIAFVDFACRWVASIDDKAPIDSFEISVPNPEYLKDNIKSWIAFAVGKKVKNLVLDFKHPTWRNIHDVIYGPHKLVFELPESVYNLTTLESLKVYACKNFEPWRFSNPEILKTLSFGWMRLPNLESFLLVSSSLLSLIINACWGIDGMKIVGNMREVAVENCQFGVLPYSFNLPRVEIYRYSGKMCNLEFKTMNPIIKEVYLDFGVSFKFGCVTSSRARAPCHILNGLPSVGTLTLCHYMLQVINMCKYLCKFHPAKIQHLVLKTKLDPKELRGIMILLENCWNLETLTLDLLRPTSVMTTSSYIGIDPQTFWMRNIKDDCMIRKTLKVVVVRNFVGGPNELNVIKYLIWSGREPDIVLERVELHVPYGLDESRKKFVYEGAEMLQQRLKHVQVLVHNSC